MDLSRHIVFLGLAYVLVTPSAFADAILPVAPASTPTQLAFPVIVAVEAISLKLLLYGTFPRMVWIAFLAIVASTVAGEALNAAIGAHFERSLWGLWAEGGTLAGVCVLGFFFVLSSALEFIVVSKMTRDTSSRQIARAVALANAVSYLGLASVILQ